MAIEQWCGFNGWQPVAHTYDGAAHIETIQANAIIIDGNIVTRENVRKMQSELDALTANVEALHKTLSTVIKSASADTDFESMMIEKAKSVLSATPQQHLREIRADAIEEALDYMLNNTSSGNSSGDDFDLIRDYAGSIRNAKDGE